MREHGVPFPQPNLSGKAPIFSTAGLNTKTTEFENALTKCRPELDPIFSMTTSAAPPTSAAP
jgi:hypothetical protein